MQHVKTTKVLKCKRDCRNIGNAERRLNNLANVWKYVVFASPHSTFYVNTLEFVPKYNIYRLKMQWETNISFRFIHLLNSHQILKTLRQLILSDTLVKTTKQPCARSMYWFSILPQNSSAVNERTNIFQSSRIIFALCNTFAVCLFKKFYLIVFSNLNFLTVHSLYHLCT